MTDEAAAQATTDEQTQDTTTEQPSALRQAAQDVTQTQTSTQSVPIADRIPEKFRTLKEDGTLDIEASSAKMADSYTYLEKKLGSGEAPPKAPEEYQVTFSDDVPIKFDDIKEDPVLQDFMGGAHKLGMTNAQVSYVLDQYMRVLPQDVEAHTELDANETIAALKETTWKTDSELKAGLADAYRAVTMIAGADADYLMDKFGNDPAFIRYNAMIGQGLREDSPPQAMQMVSPDEFTDKTHSLRQSLIDMPLHDPRRPAIQRQLDELYTRQYGDTPAN